MQLVILYSWGIILCVSCVIPYIGAIVALVFMIIISLDIAKNFGKGAGFGVGLCFLPYIFYPILGFGDASYSPVTITN
jgi:predicted PurR-regulated permease PerM